MKKLQILAVAAVLFSLTTLSSCQVIGGIFKAGMWAGVLLVVAVVGIVIFIIAKVAGGGK